MADAFVIKSAFPKTTLDDLLGAEASANKAKGVVVQVFDRNAIASRLHLVAAYTNAKIAFKNRTNRAKSMAAEMLLFAAMTDQIGAAIRSAGAKEGAELVVFASSASAFKRVRPALRAIRGFKLAGPDDALLLQKMVISRLAA